jgi:DNA-binding LytR/AlgR family response regulator
MLQPRTAKYYPDIPFFLVAIPFIAAINYFLTYTNIRFNSFLALTFAIDTVQGYLAWWLVRSLIIWLDRKMPYHSGTVRRIAVQLPLTLFSGLFVIATTTELVSWIAKGKPAPLHFYTIDLIIIAIWFFVINGVYIILHYYHEWKTLAQSRKEAQQLLQGGLLVKQGKADYKLPFDELAGCYVEGDYVLATNRAGKKFFLDQSLDKLEPTLPQTLFFRLNRQYIVHQQMLMGFKRGENGKLEILLHPHDILPASITVSRTKAPAFKAWFRPQD